MTYDLVIIGAGPAGITASIYAARKRMNFILITKDIGGQAAWSGTVENYTGFQLISGIDLIGKFEEHLRQYNIPVRENEEVTELYYHAPNFLVRTAGNSYESRTVIVASGKKSRELGVPGEHELRNKGVAYCATCDGPLFAGKNVAVVGGGNSALDAALQMAGIAKHVYLITNASSLTGDPVMREKTHKHKNISILFNATVIAITGTEFVEGLSLYYENAKHDIAVEGVFIEIGLLPNAVFAPQAAKNELGEIIVNCRNETNIPGLFAAGDVTNVPEKQIIIAAGDGAKTALGAFRYLMETEK